MKMGLNKFEQKRVSLDSCLIIKDLNIGILDKKLRRKIWENV